MSASTWQHVSTLTDATVVIKAFLAEEDMIEGVRPCGCHGNMNSICVHMHVSLIQVMYTETTNILSPFFFREYFLLLTTSQANRTKCWTGLLWNST